MKWNTNLYDRQHDFVAKYGEDVVQLLAPEAGERILDLGCGTGDLAQLISSKGAKVTGLDSSPDMIGAARIKYPDIQFDIKSADDFSYEEKFDAVFSNATLHWVLNHLGAIRSIHNALKPHGRFVAEFGGKGNVSSIVNALKRALIENGHSLAAAKQVWYFPSLSEYASLLEANGFRVQFAAHFDRPTVLKENDGIRNWLQMFGQSYLEGIEKESIATILGTVEDSIRATSYREGKWHADYVRLRIIAVKNLQ